VPSEHQGLPAVAEGRKDLGATHAPHRLNGAQDRRRGWHPACPLVGEGPAWDQRVHVAMRVAGLLPGVSEHEATAGAPQGVRAALAPRLAGRPHQQGEPGALVGEDERVERRRQGKAAVAIGHWQQCGWSRFEPCCRGEGLARGTVAMATRVGRIAREATRPARCRLSPALRGPTGQEGLPHLLVGGRHGGGGAGCLARAAPAVGDFPRWSGVLCPAYGGVAAPGERGQGRSPRQGAAGYRPAKEPRGAGCWRGGGGQRAKSGWWDRGNGARASAGWYAGQLPLRVNGWRRSGAACGGLCHVVGGRRAWRGKKSAVHCGGAGAGRGPGLATATACHAPAANQPAVRPADAPRAACRGLCGLYPE
jgi:hypothetical protein